MAKNNNHPMGDIGLSGDAREQVIDMLNIHLADMQVLYTKTRNYHWNVTGIHFHSLHELFEEQYEKLAVSIDELAERVRQVGGIAIGTLDEFKEHARLKEEPGNVPDAPTMIANLTADHEAVIRHLREDADKIEELGDMGTNDFLIGMMQDHEKMAWMLRAHIANEG